MKIDNTEVYGFIPALRGMRSPKNSWNRQDTTEVQGRVLIGPNDYKLAKTLIKAGSEHCKFLRQIQVWFDMEMPRYFHSEFDTYKFNSKNSCSTMHRLLNSKEEIKLDAFVFEKVDRDHFVLVVAKLNDIRNKWLSSNDNEVKRMCVRRAKQILPEAFLQKRTVNTNYAELRNIYHQRKNHRLKEEWQDTFCEWVKSLPYSEFITE